MTANGQAPVATRKRRKSPPAARLLISTRRSKARPASDARAPSSSAVVTTSIVPATARAKGASPIRRRVIPRHRSPAALACRAWAVQRFNVTPDAHSEFVLLARSPARPQLARVARSNRRRARWTRLRTRHPTVGACPPQLPHASAMRCGQAATHRQRTHPRRRDAENDHPSQRPPSCRSALRRPAVARGPHQGTCPHPGTSRSLTHETYTTSPRQFPTARYSGSTESVSHTPFSVTQNSCPSACMRAASTTRTTCAPRRAPTTAAVSRSGERWTW